MWKALLTLTRLASKVQRAVYRQCPILISLGKRLIFSQCKPVPHRHSRKRNKDAALAPSTDLEINFKTAPSVAVAPPTLAQHPCPVSEPLSGDSSVGAGVAEASPWESLAGSSFPAQGLQAPGASRESCAPGRLPLLGEEPPSRWELPRPRPAAAARWRERAGPGDPGSARPRPLASRPLPPAAIRSSPSPSISWKGT